MKKIICLLAAWILAAPIVGAADPADPATAPAPLSRFSLGAYLAYWNIQDLTEFEVNGAFGGGIRGQYRLHDYCALELRLSGFAAGDSEDVQVPGEGWYDNEITLVAVPLEAGLVGFLPLGQTFHLYGGPGIGYFFFDGQFRSTQGPVEITHDIELDDEVGFYALFGVRAQLARNVALFAEGKYNWVETSVKYDVSIFQAKQDLDFSGLALQAGMIFTF